MSYYSRILPYLGKWWKKIGLGCFLSGLLTLSFTSIYWGNIKSFAWMGKFSYAVIFLLLLFTFVMVVMVLPFYVAYRRLFTEEVGDKDCLFLTLLLALYIVLAFWMRWIGIALEGEPIKTTVFPFGKVGLIAFALPIVSAPMIIVSFFEISVSLVFAFSISFAVAFLFGSNLWLFFYCLVSSFGALYMLHPYSDRIKPIRTGLWIGIFQAFLAFSYLFLSDYYDWTYYFSYGVVAFLSGLLSGILASGIVPAVEHLFNYTTDTKLVELSSMEHPLLRELLLQAPGTYHHSMIVGTMVEVAAKSVGARGLLAKVAAFYHDVGKIKKPLYFIENQFGCENRHEKLAPSMSSLILISHVKDGVELARKYRLGKPIIDIIQQHHGTSLISYFYHKALEARTKVQQGKKNIELPPVNIEDYRYPGPKPQTKEAGLVMLADMTEAACRSLPNPTPARIQGMINKIINQAFIDGQLNECELTLKDLHLMAKHFYQILAAIHHKRIEYPQTADQKKGAGDDKGVNAKPPESEKNRPSEVESPIPTSIKRLGL